MKTIERILLALAVVVMAVLWGWTGIRSAGAAELTDCHTVTHKAEGRVAGVWDPARSRTYLLTQGGTNYPGAGAQNSNLRCEGWDRGVHVTVNRDVIRGSHSNVTLSFIARHVETGEVIFLQHNIRRATPRNVLVSERPRSNGRLISIVLGDARDEYTVRPRLSLKRVGLNHHDYEIRHFFVGTETSGDSTVLVNLTIKGA